VSSNKPLKLAEPLFRIQEKEGRRGIVLEPRSLRDATESVAVTELFILRRQWETEVKVKGKGSPYSIAERRVWVPELIPVLCRQPGGRLPLLSARPAVNPATLKRAATNFAAW